MATHVEEFFRTLNMHHLYQCSKEELSVLADRFEVTLTSRLKEAKGVGAGVNRKGSVECGAAVCE